MHTRLPIARGEFVLEYAGEMIPTSLARKRNMGYDSRGDLYMLVVREHVGTGGLCLRINIDPTHCGNAARFANHSCDGGNLELVVARGQGCPVPRVAMFAREDIPAGAELTFSYGQYHADLASGDRTGLRCHCGTEQCQGFMPREAT